MKSLEYLAKEDPAGYFAEPVDSEGLPGYMDVVNLRGRRLAWCGLTGPLGWSWRTAGRHIARPPICVKITPFV